MTSWPTPITSPSGIVASATTAPPARKRDVADQVQGDAGGERDRFGELQLVARVPDHLLDTGRRHHDAQQQGVVRVAVRADRHHGPPLPRDGGQGVLGRLVARRQPPHRLRGTGTARDDEESTMDRVHDEVSQAEHPARVTERVGDGQRDRQEAAHADEHQGAPQAVVGDDGVGEPREAVVTT